MTSSEGTPGERDAAPREVVLVAALDLAGVIGVDNKLPWHLPRDLKRFRALTLDKPVIMGRRTFESIGRPLPRRVNIVLTRASAWQPPEGCERAHTLAQALARAGAHGERAMVIGGAGVFAAALAHATRLELTVVQARVAGDTYFPPVPAREWRLAAIERAPADDANAFDCAFVTLERAEAHGAGGQAIAWPALIAPPA